MTYHLMYLEEPPSRYAKLSDHPTVQHALDWLNTHLSGGFVRFENTTLVGSPHHCIRPSQFVLMSRSRDLVPLKYESGVISMQEEV